MLLRILFENLLYEVLLKGFGIQKQELIFNSKSGVRREFSDLISIFSIILDKEIKVFDSIDNSIISFLQNPIRKFGNFSAHELIPQVLPSFIDEIQEKINFNLNILIHLLVKVQQFPLSEDSEQKIRTYLDKRARRTESGVPTDVGTDAPKTNVDTSLRHETDVILDASTETETKTSTEMEVDTGATGQDEDTGDDVEKNVDTT